MIRKCVIYLQTEEGHTLFQPYLISKKREYASAGPPFEYRCGPCWSIIYHKWVNRLRHIYNVYIYICIHAFSFVPQHGPYIHLELTPDLSAAMFLLAFRRYISRRGTLMMISNNAKVFKAPTAVIKEVV